MELSPEQVKASRSPYDEMLGSRMVEASGSRVVMELDVRPDHQQPMGVVHGGVYASIIESAASVGATLWLDGDGWAAGITNSTDFLRSARDGRLTFVATPIQQGRSLQLWEVAVTDGEDRMIAHGKVKLTNFRASEGRA